MVYCVKCGAQNPDDAQVCTKCGASLYSTGERRPYRQIEDECFGFPKSSGIVSLVIGLVIIIVGLGLMIEQIYNISIWWPMILVFFGLLIIIGAIYRSRVRY